MRFNKQELITLATQPSNKFDKEGRLYVTEKQEGFFRKTEGNGKLFIRTLKPSNFRDLITIVFIAH